MLNSRTRARLLSQVLTQISQHPIQTKREYLTMVTSLSDTIPAEDFSDAGSAAPITHDCPLCEDKGLADGGREVCACKRGTIALVAELLKVGGTRMASGQITDKFCIRCETQPSHYWSSASAIKCNCICHAAQSWLAAQKAALLEADART